MSEAAGKRAGPVSVERIDERNCDAAIALEVAEEHLHYVLPVAEMLKRDGLDEALENYAVRAAGVVVGFFRLDFDRRRVSEYAGNGSYCGLRGYLIGRRHQGRGYGFAAIPAIPAIRDLMHEKHPDVAEIVLTVNLRNDIAISTYKKAGFRDTGEIYHGGNNGPQHVFSLPLR